MTGRKVLLESGKAARAQAGAPFLVDPDVTIWCGSALEVLSALGDGSAQACVTSPPYWGLRDYGVDGQLGLEATPEEYVAAMVAVFREVRRVLAGDGTLWLNLGDSYSHGGNGARDPERWPKQSRNDHRVEHPNKAGGKPKDLVGIPWMVAFALRADGWYLRSDIIWSKPNPMPESVTDRPTKSHEYVFLLSKSPRYFFDADAVREPFEARPQQRLTTTAEQPKGAGRAASGVHNPLCQGGTDLPKPLPQTETLDGSDGEAPRGPDGRRVTAVKGGEGSAQHRDGERWPNGGRNVRSVWEIATQPYAEAHFATYPEELVRRCILAGSAPGDVILDPFGGSGTTALVARKHGRRAVLVELNEAYCVLAARRLSQLSLLAEGAA